MDDFVLIKSAFGVITTFWSNFALETKFEHVHQANCLEKSF